jgi:penicillin-binding protein 1C
MLEIFDLLGTEGVNALLKDRPPGVLLAVTRDLPPALQHFDRTARRGGAVSGVDANGPSVEYPPQASVVEVQDGGSVLVEVRGGAPPYHWLVDGRYTATTRFERRFAWRTLREGPVTVSVVDAEGRSARVGFAVQLVGSL